MHSRVRIWASCFLQAEEGIRDLVRSRGLGDVYKRQIVIRHRILLEKEIELLRKVIVNTTLAECFSQDKNLSLIHI